MDKLYYDNNTRILLNTPGLTIGKTSFKQTHFETNLFRESDIAITPATHILGVPIIYIDKIKDIVKFKKPLFNIDINYYLELDDTYKEKNRNLNIFLHIDFSKQMIIYTFFGSMDIFSKLGGYKGAFEPIIMYFFPMWVLSFMINYSNTIKVMYKATYKLQLERTLRKAYDRLKKVPNL